jgi:hypothetical protein
MPKNWLNFFTIITEQVDEVDDELDLVHLAVPPLEVGSGHEIPQSNLYKA